MQPSSLDSNTRATFPIWPTLPSESENLQTTEPLTSYPICELVSERERQLMAWLRELLAAGYHPAGEQDAEPPTT